MKHFHLVGIGGAGLSAIARVLLESGQLVSGSDEHIKPWINCSKFELDLLYLYDRNSLDCKSSNQIKKWATKFGASKS